VAVIYIFETYKRRGITLTQDEKWAAVKDHYERAYPMQSHHFRVRLSDEAVDAFYKNMMQLRETEHYYLQRMTPRQLDKFTKLSNKRA
jgi:hypothetical protein